MGGRAKFHGREAFKNGVPLHRNPFRGKRTPDDLVNEIDWEEGWIKARDDEEPSEAIKEMADKHSGSLKRLVDR
jgi:hypothetical protein